METRCGYTWDLGFCECVLSVDHDGQHECKCFDRLPRGTEVCPVCLDGAMHWLADQRKGCPACKGAGRVKVVHEH